MDEAVDGAFETVAMAHGAARAVVRPAHALALCDGHFPGEPLVPGSSLAALMADVGARLLGARGARQPVLAEIVRCVFRAPVRPEAPIVVVAHADGARIEAEVRVGDVAAARAILRFVESAA